ncbi:MAG: hypothetical protein QNJ70_00985 [Xenococcaceae cyanobacterium MO_207.B15]|nr:hypothetical protein [Xenococcaceae cyanobacterium MO_207.B15]MDJ0743334.1 hypothetical protein [Xenococcaceae cyanobacterium MO_167.B27]
MLRRAIAFNPQNWCALVFLAGCFKKLGKYPEESEKLLTKAASLTNQRHYEALLAHINL